MHIGSLIDTIRTTPQLAALRIDGRPLVDAFDELAIVDVSHDGKASRPIARNAAAERLLGEPGMTDAISGVLRLNANRSHGADLQTLLLPVGAPGDPLQFGADTDLWTDQNSPIWDALATSPRRHAFVAGKLAISIHQLLDGKTDDELAAFVRDNASDIVPDVIEAMEAWQHRYLWSGQASRGAVVVSPDIVDGWRALVRAEQTTDWTPRSAARRNAAQSASVPFHELEHVRSYPGLEGDYERRAWLEEGSASVLSDWVSERNALTAATGMPAGMWIEDPGHSYATYTRIVRRLLTAAGIDERVAGSKAAADALLQDHPLEEVPGVLARAAALHLGRGEDPGYVARLRRAIQNGTGTAAHLRHIERVLERA